LGAEKEPLAAHDALGIGEQANALSKFIAEAGAPLTIGIQGEWEMGRLHY
jgi:hypothetical protein